MLFNKKNLKLDDLILSLAALFQCAVLADELAQAGKCDEQAFNTLIKSLIIFDSPDTEAVYEDAKNLKIGIYHLIKVFEAKKTSRRDRYVSIYALGMLRLQKKLMQFPKKVAELRKRLEFVEKQIEYFSIDHQTVIANLADIYLNAISSFNFKIQIIGHAEHLNNSKVLEKIRALFLAGMRASVLWHQLGGSRWHLLFNKKKYVTQAKNILATL